MENCASPLNQDCEVVFAVLRDLSKRRELVSLMYVEAVWLHELPVSISLMSTAISNDSNAHAREQLACKTCALYSADGWNPTQWLPRIADSRPFSPGFIIVASTSSY